jgi:probable HAF family extracellular repeat protein
VAGGLFATFEAEASPSAHACQVVRYSVVALPFLPDVVSAAGLVAGIDEMHRAVVWRGGSDVHEIPVPEGFRFVQPVAVTPRGGLVINAFDAQSRKHQSFVYANNAFISLLGGQTLVHGVSPSGLIVGEWVPEGATRSSAGYWRNNSPYSIGLCCSGIIKAANRAGDVVGDAYDEQGRYHAFMWSESRGLRTVGPTLGYSSAVAIDNAGNVLLQVGREGYLEHDGAVRHLDLAPKLYNSAHGMNNCDFVVGGYGTDSDHYRAFVWNAKAGFRDLNSLIPADSGWLLEEAIAINDHGEIVGRGNLHHDDSGFLLIPRH